MRSQRPDRWSTIPSRGCRRKNRRFQVDLAFTIQRLDQLLPLVLALNSTLPAATVAAAGVASTVPAKSTADMSAAAAESACEMSAAAKKWPAAKPANIGVGVPVVRIKIRRRIVHRCRVLATPVPTPYPVCWVCADRLGIGNHRSQRGCESNGEKSNCYRFLHGVSLQARLDC